MDHIARAKEIITQVTYVTIATASNGAEPWSTPVHSAFDEKYNLYWTSMAGTRHSKNIQENPRVHVSVYDPTICGRDGVYMKGLAEELSDVLEIRTASALLYKNKNKEPRPVEEFLGESPRRMYKAVPEQFWISLDADAKIDPVNSKREINLL